MRMSEGVEWTAHACVLLAALPPGIGLPANALAEFHELAPAYMAKHMQALAHWQATGEETSLKSTCNTDQGAPYLPRAMISDRDARALEARLAALEQASMARAA